MTTTRPAAKSVTKRRALTNDARKFLGAYRNLTAVKPTTDDMAVRLQDAAVKRLLWAEAMVQQALYLQTNGQLGVQNATANSVRRQHEAR